MSATQTYGKSLGSLATASIVLVCFALSANSAEKTYSPKNADEVEVISLILASEARANNWTKDDLICFSIDDQDPDKKLVKTLRQHGLNVCRLSEWRKSFSCGFHVRVRFISFDASQTARLHAEIADVREINSGNAHLAVRLRDGEYTLRKTEGKWTLGDYVPSK